MDLLDFARGPALEWAFAIFGQAHFKWDKTAESLLELVAENLYGSA
jgi:hypothetical protein